MKRDELSSHLGAELISRSAFIIICNICIINSIYSNYIIILTALKHHLPHVRKKWVTVLWINLDEGFYVDSLRVSPKVKTEEHVKNIFKNKDASLKVA